VNLSVCGTVACAEAMAFVDGAVGKGSVAARAVMESVGGHERTTLVCINVITTVVEMVV